MLYAGGARQVRPDGSIEIHGKPRMLSGPIIAPMVLSLLLPVVLLPIGATEEWGMPLILLLFYGPWALALLLPRLATRRVVFDASAKRLHVADSGLGKGHRTIAFSNVHALTVEQREPRWIANALPVLTVNGVELLSVDNVYANANLERELQELVGLPLSPSPSDTSAWAGPG